MDALFFLPGEEELPAVPSAEDDEPVWVPSDCCFDPEDPYNPCGPHHGTK